MTADHVGGSLALGDLDGKRLAFVADEDDKLLHVLDVDQHTELLSQTLAGIPAQVMVGASGRVLVTLRDTGVVQVFVPAEGGRALGATCTVPVAAEPFGLAESRDGSTVVVTSGWGHALDILRGADLAVKSRVSLAREPRGVLVSEDGHRATVSHMVGSKLSVVDLTSGALREVDVQGPPELRSVTVRQRARGGQSDTRQTSARRASVQGYALAKIGGRLLEPRVLVDAGDLDEVPVYYGSDDRPAQVPDMLVVQDPPLPSSPPAARARSGRRSPAGGAPHDDCRLPRAIAENAADHTALVTCLGSNTLVEYSLDAPGVDGAAEARMVPRSRWPVAAGPTGVVYDGKHAQALVWSQFDHAVDVVALPAGSLEDRLVTESARVTRWNLARPASFGGNGDSEVGRTLFYSTGDERLSREGLACASCHPDGRDDALTWATSEGPRQTPMLAGRLEGTAPYAWNGASPRVSEHLEHTLQRLGGRGLSEREMKAIGSYCLSMTNFTPPSGAAARSASSPALVARGEQVFRSPGTGCSSCHASASKGSAGAADAFTDGETHDVSSRTASDESGRFDTPSLRFVGGTAPYFHDGRYASLADLIRGADGTMGHTSQLSGEDRSALEAYLQTL